MALFLTNASADNFCVPVSDATAAAVAFVDTTI
jgi:hypothetical protein